MRVSTGCRFKIQGASRGAVHFWIGFLLICSNICSKKASATKHLSFGLGSRVDPRNIRSGSGDSENDIVSTINNLLFVDDADELEQPQPQESTSSDSDDNVWLSSLGGGISDEDVEELVQQVMRDPSINIMAIPDALEAHIYRSTIKVVLDVIYELLGKLHGAKLGATEHEIQLKRCSLNPTLDARRNTIRHQYQKTDFDTTDIKEDVLEEVAEGLLSNRNINQRFLPDVIEKRLYINCLTLIFRLMEMLADSIKITVCGHDLRLSITQTTSTTTTNNTLLETATIRMADIDASKLYEIAARAGLNNTRRRGWWWFSRKKLEFLQTLHASLIALLLSILDDLMHKTCIELFSDRMVLDIVPSSSSISSTEHDGYECAGSVYHFNTIHKKGSQEKIRHHVAKALYCWNRRWSSLCFEN